MMRRAMNWTWAAAWCVAVGAAGWAGTPAARAQVVITEIMYDTASDENVWEWIEVLNTSGAPVDLSGWVYDDDDDADFFFSNISSDNGNTMVPAGGVAVLYNGQRLDYDPARFTNAWGTGITLVPFNINSGTGAANFVALGNGGDALGLWSSHESYLLDAIPEEEQPPLRRFDNAVTSVNYDMANGYPSVMNGQSIAWNGTGSVTDPANWVASVDGQLGAKTSVATTVQGAQANNTADAGSPGVVPQTAAGPIPQKLIISEIMSNPASIIGSVETGFEWVEIYNNTGSLIDFSATPYVLHDDDGAKLAQANINNGTIAQGGTAVIYRSSVLTVAEMHTAWGAGINFIAVDNMGNGFANGSDKIGIWDSYTAYDTEAVTGPGRTMDNAIAVVEWGEGWLLPSGSGGGSLFMTDLSGPQNDPANWGVSVPGFNDAVNAQPVFTELADHAGGDVGSPGFVPSAEPGCIDGDFNCNGAVENADLTLLLNNWGIAVPPTPEGWIGQPPTAPAIDNDELTALLNNWGIVAGSASASAGAVPEPGSVVLVALGMISAGLIRRRSH